MAENTKPKSPEEEEKKKEKSNLLEWIILIILIILLLLSLTRCQGCSNSGLPDPNFGDTRIAEVPDPDVPEVDPNARSYVEPVAEKAAESGGITIPGWNTLNIPKNETEVTVDLYNPEANAGRYQMTFELRLPNDSEQGYEVLYKSGLVDPGLHIQHITLSHGLEAGTYEATIHVQPYKMDEQKTATNNADMATKLIVE